MRGKKLIGVLMTNPQAVYQQRTLSGIIAQSRKYDYDVAVFTPMVQTCHFDKAYLQGEMNLFEMVNLDLLDGVIAVTLAMTEERDMTIIDYWKDRLKKVEGKPVVAMDLPLSDKFPTVYTDDKIAFHEMTSHVIDVHDCKKVYFLTGQKGYEVAERRLQGFLEEMKSRNLDVPEDWIFYGDFWYTGGEQLADRIISGEVERPDAVICASDHMALGLTKRLYENGIKVPNDIIVTGYDATPEAAMDDLSVTSFIPNIGTTAAEAVNVLASMMEPGREIQPLAKNVKGSIYIGESCGCTENTRYLKHTLRESFYMVNGNYVGDKQYENNIGRLMENYMLEYLAAATSTEDCLNRVCQRTYLFMPYDEFHLCLRDNWHNTDEKLVHGFPEKMNYVMKAIPYGTKDYDPNQVFCNDDSRRCFDTKLMLPRLFDNDREPSIFYFTPVHFQDDTLGYCVLQNSLKQTQKINLVFRLWVRNMNNSLEMIRVQNELRSFSMRDPMTGLYNRRGMGMKIEELSKKAKENDKWLVFVADMDGLKNINDVYGHSEGDFAITVLSKVIRGASHSEEFCVRAGGDEFYIIGLGNYTEQDAQERINDFQNNVSNENKFLEKPYTVSASIGCCCSPFSGNLSIDNIIRVADSNMYRNKASRKSSGFYGIRNSK